MMLHRSRAQWATSGALYSTLLMKGGVAAVAVWYFIKIVGESPLGCSSCCLLFIFSWRGELAAGVGEYMRFAQKFGRTSDVTLCFASSMRYFKLSSYTCSASSSMLHLLMFYFRSLCSTTNSSLPLLSLPSQNRARPCIDTTLSSNQIR